MVYSNICIYVYASLVPILTSIHLLVLVYACIVYPYSGISLSLIYVYVYKYISISDVDSVVNSPARPDTNEVYCQYCKIMGSLGIIL